MPIFRRDDLPAPEVAARMMADTKPRIGEKEIAKAAEILSEYKLGKAMLEKRIIDDELWWELRHLETMRNRKDADTADRPEPTSAWLFNAIINKHADAMDNYPEPVVLPRERDDEQSAKTMSSVVPVVLEYNGFEQTYSDNWWDKLKHGTAPYGVFWNKRKENGLGDIDIQEIDLLKLFWEPGITDIQQSRNLFIVELVDEDVLDAMYPQYAGKLGGSVIDVAQYVYDDTVDTADKSVVVDWYYKTRNAAGRTIVHYVKFVGNVLLYASENDPELRERGFYDHGQYPVVLDVLFPEKGTPVGFGYVAICKDPQMYIDKLSGSMLQNAMMATRKRFFISSNTGVNEKEFLDWNRPLVHVEGELDDRRIQEITTQPLSGVYVDLIQAKIEEMKDTAANRDVNSGGVGSGVTAAAAIAALQEAGNKVSRDMISASYRAYVDIVSMCIELMRQFYDTARTFRVTGANAGEYDFVEMSNASIRPQLMPSAYPEQAPVYRQPVFDIKIRAQRKNPFSRMEQNERAKELYSLGFFNPERAQEAMGALNMMEFEGIDKVREQVQQGDTLLNLCQRMSQQMDQMALLLQTTTGRELAVGAAPAQNQAQGASNSIARAVVRAQTPAQDYGTRLAQRSVPNMDVQDSEAGPR